MDAGVVASWGGVVVAIAIAIEARGSARLDRRRAEAVDLSREGQRVTLSTYRPGGLRQSVREKEDEEAYGPLARKIGLRAGTSYGFVRVDLRNQASLAIYDVVVMTGGFRPLQGDVCTCQLGLEGYFGRMCNAGHEFFHEGDIEWRGIVPATPDPVSFVLVAPVDCVPIVEFSMQKQHFRAVANMPAERISARTETVPTRHIVMAEDRHISVPELRVADPTGLLNPSSSVSATFAFADDADDDPRR